MKVACWLRELQYRHLHSLSPSGVRLLPFWGRRRLDAIEPRHFDEFKARLVAEKLAPRTVNIELALLKQLLRFAADRGYAKDGLTRWITFQRKRPSEIRPFPFEEKAKFLKALLIRWRPYFEIAFGTGLRPSEQLALKWTRADWKRKKLQVVEGWRDGEITGLKVLPAHREVDLLRSVFRALGRQRLVAGGSELVFPNSRGTYMRLDNLRTASGVRRLRRPSSRSATSTRRGTPSQRMPWPPARIPAGLRRCWATRRSR